MLVEKASGVSLWSEWLKLELQGEHYRPPRRVYRAAALLQCLSRQEQPDLGDLQCPETVWTLRMPRHAGVILASPDRDSVTGQAQIVLHKLEREHLAIVPPIKKVANR